MCKEYNGWANYETWVVNLWIDNDSGLLDYCYELAVDNYDYPGRVGDSIREYLEQDCDECFNDILSSASLYADLMGAAFCTVNWYDIGQAMIDGAIDAGLLVKCSQCESIAPERESCDGLCLDCYNDAEQDNNDDPGGE